LRTFSIIFEQEEFSEAEPARLVARYFGAEHHEKLLTGRQVADDLDGVLGALDQPTGDGINTYYVSQAAHAGGVKVALSGLGGDELFGGYPSFRDLPRLARLLPFWQIIPSAARHFLIERVRRGNVRGRKLGDFLEHAGNLNELCSLQRRVFSEPMRQALLHGDARTDGAISVHHPELAALEAELAGADGFQTISAWEMRTYMADVLLRDSDVMSMRHSLELRVPFVDVPLVEWLWAQPSRFKHDLRRPKSALADVLGGILPQEILHRKKMGFTLPFAHWMRRELKPFLDSTFSAASVANTGLLDPAAAQAQWRQFQAGNDNRAWSRVWSLAVLIHFLNRSSPPSLPAGNPESFTLSADAPVSVPAPSASTKTLLLCPQLFAAEGGIARILRLYLKALCDQASPGSEVRVIVLNDATAPSAQLKQYSNGRMREATGCNRGKLRFVAEVLRQSVGCHRIICGHLHQLTVALAAKRWRPQLDYYLVAHGVEVWRPYTLLETAALRGATKILCVSEFTRRKMLSFDPGLDPARLVVLPNALDPYFQATANALCAEPAAEPLILTVSRLQHHDAYKGIDHLIQAMPVLRERVPGARLRIVGTGDDQPRLETLTASLGLDGAVEFMGFVDDAELNRQYGLCRVFALPSKKEGFGLVFLEAMAYGKPCLGARDGGIPEVINDHCGALVDYGNVTQIAGAAARLLLQPPEPSAVRNHVRQFTYVEFLRRFDALLG
jgi:glycosyltransferase involved in cell wall biosynthesis